MRAGRQARTQTEQVELMAEPGVENRIEPRSAVLATFISMITMLNNRWRGETGKVSERIREDRQVGVEIEFTKDSLSVADHTQNRWSIPI